MTSPRAASGPMDGESFGIETVAAGEQRSFHVVHLDRLDQWPEELPLRGRSFALWVGGDTATLPVDVIREFAAATMRQGLVYLCTWGPGCERLHDTFDLVEVEFELTPPDVDVVMTTWHDEPLSESLWFFSQVAWPAEDRAGATRDWFAVVVDGYRRDEVRAFFARSDLT